MRGQMERRMRDKAARGCVIAEDEWDDCCPGCRYCRVVGDVYRCEHDAPLPMTKRRAVCRRHCQHREERR